jgi:hypothetical protein
METPLFLRIEIIVLGLFLLGIISSVIYNCVKEKTISSFFIGFLGVLVVGGFPAWGFYINLNKYLTKPKPTNVIETCLDGEIRLLYQDTTHLCHPSEKNSTCFTSFLSLNDVILLTDTCTICGKHFLDHYTRQEYRYYEAVAYGTDAYYNSLSANLENSRHSIIFMIITKDLDYYTRKRVLHLFFVILLFKAF